MRTVPLPRGTGNQTGFLHGYVDEYGNIYVTGATKSNELTFPVKWGPDITSGGDWDVFVAKINASGTHLEYCGYIGGEKEDCGYAIAFDSKGRMFDTTNTASNGARLCRAR